jgi:hypothetical protein
MLPVAVQHEARAAYKQFVKDPWHPSLHLESVQGKRGRTYYSVRVGLHYRALADRLPDTWLWFWIGTHAEYSAGFRFILFLTCCTLKSESCLGVLR